MSKLSQVCKIESRNILMDWICSPKLSKRISNHWIWQ